MDRTSAFDEFAGAYDQWFENHASYYRSELAAIRQLLPVGGTGIEIGVGSGQFSAPLGITTGLDPSPAMLARARTRGILAIRGVAEYLPFKAETFDCVLFVTTICFLESLNKALDEAFRVLKQGGSVVIGFIDKQSPLGKAYEQRRDDSRFYRNASFHSVDEVADALESSGFMRLVFVQTLFPGKHETDSAQPTAEGYGDGAFVVVRGVKPGNT
jgi:ubiquinone/menaquinone biosynthesis C-methylase UbiE